ncbi:putative SNF-family helicase [Streptococcus pneumoniae]|nr:putative SNF-family helicase [Streptococcus pneumoniae]
MAVVHGLKASREEILAESHQIYVTSYATFRQDSELYQGMAFDFLFLDEAQVMKNAQTKIAQTLRQFVVPSVFALYEIASRASGSVYQAFRDATQERRSSD